MHFYNFFFFLQHKLVKMPFYEFTLSKQDHPLHRVSVRKAGMIEWCLRAGSTCASSALNFNHMPHATFNTIQTQMKTQSEGVISFQSDQGLHILHLHFLTYPDALILSRVLCSFKKL